MTSKKKLDLVPGESSAPALLPAIDRPDQLKSLSVEELKRLAEEIREFIICTVSRNGGHLAPNLGVVELTLALHYVFDSPHDRIIWDVGHQCYTHKIVTGRRSQFHTLRQCDGISGFPKRSESKYDAFGTGHSSTSISAALGIATAKHLKGCKNRTIAVIGDGSMTGGMAFEGLNQTGYSERDLIVVLNDNEMSISPNVGALSSFLSRKLSHKSLLSLRRELESSLKAIPGFGPKLVQILQRSEDSLKAFFTPGMLFQALKFHYIGPIKGHRLDRLIETFQTAKEVQGPVLIHVGTQKGHGYRPAECDPSRFHGLGAFDVSTGKSCKAADCPPSYTQVFGQCITELAEQDPRIVAITAAMLQGTGLQPFSERYPQRFFDVGIAEQHAITFAAGLAAEGFKPVAAIYSTFMQRAYDQTIHDICLQNLPVVLCMDRGGLVGEDGPTHHGVFDLSFLRHIPNMVVMAPKDENELRHMLKTAVSHNGPIAMRYPRGQGVGVPLDEVPTELAIGRGELLAEGTDLLLLAIGVTVHPALEAAAALRRRGIQAAVINARFAKPLDQQLILQWARKTDAVLTIEENVLQGGFGSAVLELFSDAGFMPAKMKRLGIPDTFATHASQKILRQQFGIDAAGIEQAALALAKESHGNPIRAVR